MSSDEYEKLAARLSAVERKLVVIEANSRKACSEQPLVGPPDKSEERPAALARPQTIAELTTWIKKEFHLDEERWRYGDFGQGMMTAAEKILYRLGKLDQGDGHSSPSEIEDWIAQKSTNFKKSE